ncbi:MAG: RNA polymerase sigma-70 factor [Bacteroidales bacterium]|nr:RNA polymerase sigma-70 factor [Bacteroidales bacterium]
MDFTSIAFMKNSSANVHELFDDDFDKAINQLFNKYYGDLCRKAFRIINNKVISEDIVQDVFFKLWENRKKIQIQTSLKAYLNRMVFNESISYLRKNKELIDFSDEIEIEDVNTNIADKQIEQKELRNIIDSAINKLPPACKTIFLLSRINELSYKQIAEKLDISIKTVENQMGKALRILRQSIKYDFVLFAIYFSDILK